MSILQNLTREFIDLARRDCQSTREEWQSGPSGKLAILGLAAFGAFGIAVGANAVIKATSNTTDVATSNIPSVPASAPAAKP